MSDRYISEVFEFTNGMVAVYDQHGKQMPEFQGPREEANKKMIGHLDRATIHQDVKWKE